MSREQWSASVLDSYEAKAAALEAQQAAQQDQQRTLTSGHHPSHLAFGADADETDIHLPATFERTRAGHANGMMAGHHDDGDDVSGTQDREAMRSANDGMDGHPDPETADGSLVPSREYDVMHRMAPFPSSSVAPPGRDGARQISVLQAKLQQRLGPEYISSRPGPGGGQKLHYLEGFKAFDLANEVFGFNGWSSEVRRLDVDFLDISADGHRFNVGITAILRITLRDGTFHEDVGYGHIENAKGKAAALEKAKKEAVTDAFKRALKSFGRLLGNCIYDKKFLDLIDKMKPEPAKYDVGTLKRAPHPSILKNGGGGGNPEPQHARAPGPSKPAYAASRPAAAAAGPSSRPAPVVEQQTSPAKRAATTPAPNKAMVEEKRREAQRRKEVKMQREAAEAAAREAALAEANSSVSGPSTSSRQADAQVVSHEELPTPSQSLRDMDDLVLDEALCSFEASADVHLQQRQATLAGDSSYAGHDDSGVALPASRQQQHKGPPPSAWSTAAPSMPIAPSARDRLTDSSSPPPIVKPEPQTGESTSNMQMPRRSASKGRFISPGGGAAKSAAETMTHGSTSLSHVAGGRSATTSGATSRTHQMLPPNHLNQQRAKELSMAGQYGAVTNGATSRPIAAPNSARGTAISYMPPQHQQLQQGARSTSMPRGNDVGFRTALQETGVVNGAYQGEASALKKQRIN